MISEGKSVPKFELNDADGNVFSSTDLRGKKYAIYFYPKDFTPGCTIEADEFSKDYNFNDDYFIFFIFIILFF